jgi:sarcosine oxidase, subunit delta
LLLIDCPWCGEREEDEFTYGGQADVLHPADPEALEDDAWARYLFVRDNPAAEWSERWFHAAGCRRWFRAVRDTRDNRFLMTAPLGPTAPAHVAAD